MVLRGAVGGFDSPALPSRLRGAARTTVLRPDSLQRFRPRARLPRSRAELVQARPELGALRLRLPPRDAEREIARPVLRILRRLRRADRGETVAVVVPDEALGRVDLPHQGASGIDVLARGPAGVREKKQESDASGSHVSSTAKGLPRTSSRAAPRRHQ